MRRSLFLAVMVRVVVGFAVVAVVWHWWPRMWVGGVVGLVVAAVVAWSCARVFERSVGPLEQKAEALEAAASEAAQKLAQSAVSLHELETLLDDDDDMAEMYLTRRAEAAAREERLLHERLQSDAELGMSGACVFAAPARPPACCNTPPERRQSDADLDMFQCFVFAASEALHGCGPFASFLWYIYIMHAN